MEGGGGGRRRRSLLDQMSAIDNGHEGLAGLTLNAVLSSGKRPSLMPTAASHSNRTLLDIIRDEEPNAGNYKDLAGHKDRKSWKAFRDRLRLKRAGAAWTSSIHIPTSDIPIHNPRSQFSRRNSVRFQTIPANSADSTQPEAFSENVPASDAPMSSGRPQFTRRISTRVGSVTPNPSESTQFDGSPESIMPSDAPVRSFRPQISRHNSTRFHASSTAESDDNDTDNNYSGDPVRGQTRRLSAALADERALSAREAVAAQEAAEAAAAAAAAEAEEEEQETGAETEAQPVRMSLMDLLEETDREMGLVGSRYAVGDDDEEYEDDEEEEEDEGEEGGGGIEHNCCVCMVRHKGAAFIPCGHTFCRLCSRELWVQRGNCPLCNGFILEILDIF